MACPFNSSNTAEESAALIRNIRLAEKWRVSPAGKSASSRILPSPSTCTCVGAEVERDKSSGRVAEAGSLAAPSGGSLGGEEASGAVGPGGLGDRGCPVET